MKNYEEKKKLSEIVYRLQKLNSLIFSFSILIFMVGVATFGLIINFYKNVNWSEYYLIINILIIFSIYFFIDAYKISKKIGE